MINAQEARNNVAKKLLEGMDDVYEMIAEASKKGESSVSVYSPKLSGPVLADLHLKGFDVEYSAGYSQRDSEFWVIRW